ncbi:hypothetical protein B7463_g3474, partial [Scytalidium lignicola]
MASISMRIFLLSTLFHSFLIYNVNAVTCFGVNGLPYTDNIICPGSNACCGSSATCMSNRLCHNPGTNNDTFIRGPCAVQPYDSNTCGAICVYNETAIGNGFFPRVTLCPDGKYCCNDQPNCCESGSGVFLDGVGDIVSSRPSSTPSTATVSSSTSSTSLPPSTAATTTSPQGAANTSSADSSSTSSGLSTGAKIGVGVSIPLGVILISALGVVIWLQQRRIKMVEIQVMANSGAVVDSAQIFQQQKYTPVPPKEMDANHQSVVSELPGEQVER